MLQEFAGGYLESAAGIAEGTALHRAGLREVYLRRQVSCGGGCGVVAILRTCERINYRSAIESSRCTVSLSGEREGCTSGAAVCAQLRR